jgi:hypothetical protein
MSPPWLTSATSESASKRRQSAIAFADQAAGDSAPAVSSAITKIVPSSLRPAATRPHASARFVLDAGGSTATTMRASGGAAATRHDSIMARDHSASARSSMISPSISWRPSFVPP